MQEPERVRRAKGFYRRLDDAFLTLRQSETRNSQAVAASKTRQRSRSPTYHSGRGEEANIKRSFYRPLDFDTFEIRLLRVHEGPRHRIITCSLEHVSLINPPEYTALSYCWGDANKTVAINLQGWGDVQVSSNLEEALVHIRDMDHPDIGMGGKGMALWVDALCINQQDPVERSQQVRHMRQVYSRAREVISWVPCSSAEAVEYLIKDHFEATRTLTPPPPAASSSEWEVYKARLESEERENSKRHGWVEQGWSILEDFFSQDYWRRVWVIQEVTVATKAKVLCGTCEIPWEYIDNILAKWKQNPESVPFDSRTYLKAMHLTEFRHRFQVKREPISLLDAMRWTYQTEATDPKDKIFALLGLCHDGPTYVPVPNYKQPLEEIIADMSRAMMSFERSLDLMCFKGKSLQEDSRLPSWTPNWVNLWSGSLHSMTAHEARYADWHTAFSFNPILYGSTFQVLKVEGRYHGSITRLTSELVRPGHDGKLTFTIEPREPWISSTSSLFKTDVNLRRPISSVIKVRNSIWQTLTMGLLPPELNDEAAALCFSKLWTPEGRGSVHNIALIEWLDRNAWFEWEGYPQLLRSLRWWSQVGCHSTPPQTVPASGKHASLQETSQNQEDKAVPFIDTFIETLEKVLKSGMRLALVRTGGSPPCSARECDTLVLAPPAAKESDQMWLIKGCSVPIILREVQDEKEEVRYKVIGGVYVSDIEMQDLKDEKKWTRGEVVEELRGRSKVLHLC